MQITFKIQVVFWALLTLSESERVGEATSWLWKECINLLKTIENTEFVNVKDFQNVFYRTFFPLSGMHVYYLP